MEVSTFGGNFFNSWVLRVKAFKKYLSLRGSSLENVMYEDGHLLWLTASQPASQETLHGWATTDTSTAAFFLLFFFLPLLVDSMIGWFTTTISLFLLLLPSHYPLERRRERRMIVVIISSLCSSTLLSNTTGLEVLLCLQCRSCSHKNIRIGLHFAPYLRNQEDLSQPSFFQFLYWIQNCTSVSLTPISSSNRKIGDNEAILFELLDSTVV